MKTLVLLLIAVACQSAPSAGFRVTTRPTDLAGCEGIPTFAPLACPNARDCQECTQTLTGDAQKLGGNALLIDQKGPECKPAEVTGVPFKCPL